LSHNFNCETRVLLVTLNVISSKARNSKQKWTIPIRNSGYGKLQHVRNCWAGFKNKM